MTGAVIPDVTTTSHEGASAWLAEPASPARFFPEAQERFREYIPAAERGEDVFDLLKAYSRPDGPPGRRGPRLQPRGSG